jgi:hypothetical protein
MGSPCCTKEDRKEEDSRNYRVVDVLNPRPILLLPYQAKPVSRVLFTPGSMKPASKKGELFSPKLVTPPIPSIPPRHPGRIKGKEVMSINEDSYFTIRPLSYFPDNHRAIMEQGLGINFYGEGSRKAESKSVKEKEETEVEILAASTPSRSGDLETQARSAQPQSVETPNHVELQSPSFNYEPFQIPDDPPLSLIENLLEDNYRGQAETFVRNSSQASVKSFSLTQTSSRSSSVASLRTNGPFELSTPTRNPSKGENLDSNQLLLSQRSLRTPGGANRVIVEPFRVQSGSSRKNNRSGFSPESVPPAPHSTYGHLVYSVPRLAINQPTITKRSERSSAPIRGPLFFTSQERQAIAELVHANPRDCERHPNCTDCHNLEYAYFENKSMPTSMPPEERQKIINNNRSLRNIKNVRVGPFINWPS